jgi:hypothetical protein
MTFGAGKSTLVHEFNFGSYQSNANPTSQRTQTDMYFHINAIKHKKSVHTAN